MVCGWVGRVPGGVFYDCLIGVPGSVAVTVCAFKKHLIKRALFLLGNYHVSVSYNSLCLGPYNEFLISVLHPPEWVI